MLRRVAISRVGLSAARSAFLRAACTAAAAKLGICRCFVVVCLPKKPCNGPGASVRVLGCGVPGCTPFWSGGEYPSMPASESEVLVGRRYLERGFLDAAMRLLVRNAELVLVADWNRLAERLLERNRIPDAVRVCELGGVPLPRERLLAAADAFLKRKDIDGALRLYELVGADRERWTRLVDLMTALPDRARQAVEIAERHLGAKAECDPPAEAPKPMR